MPPMRASAPSARSSNAEASHNQPAHHNQAPSAGMSARQAKIPVASRIVVRWLGVTPVPTRGRTNRRARRWLQDVPITISISVRCGLHPGGCTYRFDRPGLDNLPRDQGRDSQRDLANTLQQRQLDRCLRAHAEQTASDDEAAFLDSERSRDGKAQGAERLTQTLDDEAFPEIDRDADDVEGEYHFEPAEQPRYQVMQARPAEPCRRGVERLDRAIQPRDLADG